MRGSDCGAGYTPGARSPEELEMLLEDAFVTRDRVALSRLFLERAVLIEDGGRPARGCVAIARLATALWERQRTYLADPRRVLLAGDLALIVSAQAISVARRGADGTWRYALSLLLAVDGTDLNLEWRGPMQHSSTQSTTTRPGTAEAVSAHYTAGDLAEQIDRELRAANIDPDTVGVDDLARLDQLHAGFAAATRALIQRAGIAPEMRVLDVGGGLGGPARLIAHGTGAAVTVLDLTEEFVRVGELLTARVGLADRVTFRHGSALDIPFPDGAFDRVWMQNVTMNVADQERLYREIFRVLRPGGRLAMQEIVAGPVQPIHLPVPWALDASINFTRPAADVRGLLAAIGFREEEWTEERQPPAAENLPEGGPRPFPALVLGPRLPEMQTNAYRNMREGRLIRVQAVLSRP